MNKKQDYTTAILWLVYAAILLVLLPHTAWTFSQFEPPAREWPIVGRVSITAWAAAIAFELAIATLTHKLAGHMEDTPNYKSSSKRFKAYYLNAYSLGLLVVMMVSSLANLAHAYEFGMQMAITQDRPWLFAVYVFAFGAVLPFVSLLFARVLSNVSEIETANPELDKATATVRELRQAVRSANKRASEAEQRFVAAGDIVRLLSEDRTERIGTVRQLWPELPQRSAAVIAGVSVSTINAHYKNKNGSSENSG